jgi:tRNA (guanine37-N1)-methyltransferase
MEISVGDYILTGGELAAMIVVEVVSRLIPGVLGGSRSNIEESFESNLLEYPQYTRPRIFHGHEVPPVLLSGDHKRIRLWRKAQSIKRTVERRPDLLDKVEVDFNEEDKSILKKIEKEKDTHESLKKGEARENSG